jgi:putative methionine-R-sulfoxide reductase with GAF domain
VIGAAVVLSRTTNVIHRRISYRQIDAEAETVTQLLGQRSEALSAAGGLLAEDADVLQELQGEQGAASDSLKNRALAVQDRFDLSLVQVYDQVGRLRLDLVRPREGLSASTSSSILNLAEAGKTVARAVDDTLFLLCQRELPGGGGTVVVGTDLKTELQRIRLEEGLSAELGLTLRGANVGTDAGLPFDDQSFPAVPQYYRTRFILLGHTRAELLLAQSVREVGRVTRLAVIVAVSTTLVTTVSLGILNGVTVRSLADSLSTLSRAMKDVGQETAAQEVRLPSNPLTIGEGDELGLLVDSYNEMTVRLRDHCTELETDVEVYRAGLATAADVARAVASSLQLETVLKESTEIIEARLGQVCPNVHHVGIFLVEDDPNVIVLKELAGEAKLDLMRKGLRVPVGSKSPIGRAAATRRPQIVRNVKLASAHLKPPLLMDTYSAVAVPLLMGDSLIGVLDVQSKQPAAFPPSVLPLLDALAYQISSAVQNGRSDRLPPSVSRGS